MCVLFPEDSFSHSQHFLVACYSLCRVEASWSFPHPLLLSMSLVWSLPRSCVGSHADEALWVYLLTSLGASLMANSPVLWLFTLIIQWACVASHSFFTGILFHNGESWIWFWMLIVPPRGKMTWVEVRGHANEWLAQTLSKVQTHPDQEPLLEITTPLEMPKIFCIHSSQGWKLHWEIC